jgi:hypothetical protein
MSLRNLGDGAVLMPTFLTASFSTGGDPYSIVTQDSIYLWVVGRMKDTSGNEKAFHHARIRKTDGISNLAIYMDAVASLGIFRSSNSDYSVTN